MTRGSLQQDQPRTDLNLSTPELRTGDLVLNHGMLIRLGEPHEGENGVVWFDGHVENAAEFCDMAEKTYDPYIASFLRGGNARRGERDQWNVQGNELARWTVIERPEVPVLTTEGSR